MLRNDLRNAIGESVCIKKHLNVSRFDEGMKDAKTSFDYKPGFRKDMHKLLGRPNRVVCYRSKSWDKTDNKVYDWIYFILYPRKSAVYSFVIWFNKTTGRFEKIDGLKFDDKEYRYQVWCEGREPRKTATANERENALKQVRSAMAAFVRQATRLGYLQ